MMPSFRYEVRNTINALTDALIVKGSAMTRRVDAHVARTQFGQLMDRAVRDRERFVVERRGKAAVVIMSVEDYLESASDAPDWLKRSWAGAKERGVDKLTMNEIDEEIAAYRLEKRAQEG